MDFRGITLFVIMCYSLTMKRCDIYNIVSEEINKFLLTEYISTVVYHFTTFDSLKKILESNSFILVPESDADVSSNKYFYFMSFTRQKDGRLGYSKGLNVRITCDGDLLNNNYAGGPFNYFKGDGKHHYYQNIGADNEFSNSFQYQEATENEDRLYSNKPEILNASRYIKRIDILYRYPIEEDDMEDLYVPKELVPKVCVYRNEHDFHLGNNNYDLLDKTKTTLDNTNITCSNYDISVIAKILYSILDQRQILNSQKSYVYKMLESVGLERFYDQVMAKIVDLKANNYNPRSKLFLLRVLCQSDAYRPMVYLVYKYK